MSASTYKVKKFLNKNTNSELFESNNLFAKTFISKLLKEEDNLLDKEVKEDPNNFTPEKNKQDFKNSLQPDTPKKEFDVDGLSIETHVENIKKIKAFSDRLDEFASFLNDPNGVESLHKILSDNDKQVPYYAE